MIYKIKNLNENNTNYKDKNFKSIFKFLNFIYFLK